MPKFSSPSDLEKLDFYEKENCAQNDFEQR